MKKKVHLLPGFLLLMLLFFQTPAFAQSTAVPKMEPTFTAISHLYSSEQREMDLALKYFHDNWVDGYLPFLLEALHRARRATNRKAILRLLAQKTGQRLGNDVDRWYEWLWNRDIELLPFHGEWMAEVHQKIDPRFARYFEGRSEQSLIRLDEVRWGGVKQDGIPPLRQPEMIGVTAARYLDDYNVVFGISINGDHRAYPKRILAWHEMFVDEIGGENIAGIYCTLCGTVIAYNTEFEGKNYTLGTSGFLYRSNKLMYDKTTQSLWNTIEGKPVIGPLITKGIELKSHAVVTTTWGEWRKRHPDTKVLSLDTGHERNYGEGVAYQKYFATDELMFEVPQLDGRLQNKDEVLIVRAEGYRNDPLAISATFLQRNRVYHDKINGTDFVVLSDRTGGNRVYASEDVRFAKVKKEVATDETGQEWQIEEEQLISSDGRVLQRLPYHRIFWFAWFNGYPETRLVF